MKRTSLYTQRGPFSIPEEGLPSRLLGLIPGLEAEALTEAPMLRQPLLGSPEEAESSGQLLLSLGFHFSSAFLLPALLPLLPFFGGLPLSHLPACTRLP